MKTQKSKALFIIISILILIFVYPACNVSASEDSGSVKVGYFENEIFQEGASEGAVRKGYAYDYYIKLSEYTGWEYEYVYGSFSDLYQMLLDGEIDLLAGLAYTPAREGIIGYPKLAMGSETYNLVKHASDDTITTTPSTLVGKKIGVLDSAMVGALNEFLVDHDITAQVITYPSYDEVLAAFDSRQTDAYVAESDGSYDREDAELLYAFGSADYYLCVNIDRADLLSELNAAQEQLMIDEPDYINTLHIKYYPSSIASRSFSESEKNWLQSHNSLKVGYLNNYLPYSDTDKSGAVTGLIMELLPEMLAELGLDGIEVSYVGYGSYVDMIDAIGEGKVDTVFPVGGGLYYSEENNIYQSSPVISSSTVIIYNGEYSEDKMSSFALNKNNSMQYYFVKTNFPDAEISFYNSIDGALNAVKSGYAGCTTLNGIRANSVLKNRKYRGLSVKQYNSVDDRCFGVHIGNEGLLKILNRGINIVGTDRIQTLALGYSDGLYSNSLWDTMLDNMWFIAVLILVFSAVIISFVLREAAGSRRYALERETAAAELEEKNQQLGEAVREAEEANKAKDNFLSAISHDIRTPMNSILSMNEMILRESADSNVLEYAGHIESSGKTLLGLINDILDFTKIEAGKMDIIAEEYQLSSVLNDLVNLAQSMADEKGLALELNVDPELPNYLKGDEIRIKQAVTNLISNAVKYTRRGTVTFGLGCEKIPEKPDSVILKFSVKDTGIGIRQEDIGKLFEAFGRLDVRKNRNIEGTGLGIPITQRLLNLMGSTLEIESEYTVGSTFSFKLKQEVVNWETVGDFENAFKKAIAERTVYREKFTAPDAKVLVVDDTPVNLTVFKNLLKRTKMQIDAAGDAEEGIEYTMRCKYDIIFLDHMMPHKDGIETLHEIKTIEDNLNANTPTVCLTANAIAGMREMYLAAGFDDYLTKPIDPGALEDCIIRYLPEDKVRPYNPEEHKTLSPDELTEIYHKLRIHLDNGDYKDVEKIAQNLKSSDIPESDRNRVDSIVKAVSNYDYEDVFKYI